jgi:hypothetical protein
VTGEEDPLPSVRFGSAISVKSSDYAQMLHNQGP